MSSLTSKFAVLLMLSCLIFIKFEFSLASPLLKVGFYNKYCPPAEEIVRKAVYKAVASNPRTAAGLIRMHFHDCFVRGCDGSVLLDTVPGSPAAEKDSIVNNPSLHGFEVIDAAKAEIEATCAKTVSCADIIAFAARDSALIAGGISYQVPAGRRDGRVSLSDEVIQNLPAPFFNVTQLEENFEAKGLSLDEMVTLSGAHSIGVAHCFSFSNRLYNFSASHPQDPALDSEYAAFLKTICPPPSNGGSSNPTANLDVSTPFRLDNKYYVNLKYHRGLLTSDQTLLSSPSTAKQVWYNAVYGSAWAAEYAAAMVHMGSIDVLTGKVGEIRRNCHFVN
ncbi:peroxidase 5-like [Coffea arabica]|uniref:Peroxidase n=1 Tax=Coffea arabica TaxID=13443 RepID=A0A6P6UHB6_COFAR